MPPVTSALNGPSTVNAQSTTEVPTAHPMEGPIAMCPYHNALKKGDATKLRDVAAETIRDKVFGDDSLGKAEKVLIGALQVDPMDRDGKTNHLLGLTYFLQQRWGDAIKHLEIAVQRNPAHPDSQALLDKSRIAAGTRVELPGGPTAPLDKMELLKAPVLHLREPQDIKPLDTGKRGNGVATLIQNLTGKVVGAVVEGAVELAGTFRRKDVTFNYESWDSRGDLRGKLELAAMRNDLNENRLHSTYDAGLLVGHQAPGQKRPEWTERFRTATGAWTTNDPMEGAAGTEFQRTGAPVAARVSRAEDPSLPSAREVSRLMLQADGPRKTAPFLNNLAIAWIQFQNHDWVNHRPSMVDGSYSIPLKADDPLRQRYGMANLHVPKTSANPLQQDGKITYLNEVTHWWDASQIYGSDQATQDRLRMGANGKPVAGGKLRIEGDSLPINGETGVEDTGFARNWWVGLNLFHTLFVKHHNHICDTLKNAHPEWSTDQLFHTARLVNSAILAKIHTVEWTPAVLPNKKLTSGMGTNWWGMLETYKPFEKRRTDNGWEPHHPVLGGIVGGKTDNHGKPFGLSEEFVEVYRLHAGMLDHIDLRPVGSDRTVKEIDAEVTRGTGARDLVEELGMADLLNSFGHQKMNALVNNNYPAFMSEMSVDGQSVMDLGTNDILRARERGVPQYNQFRRDLGLNPLKSFKDLGVDDKTLAKLESLYGKDGIEKMDLLVGTLCETHRPENYGFGETLFQVFIQMASRRLQADPWYTEKFSEKYYSKEGMELIEHATMKDILLLHYPELNSTGLADQKNAFEPWGTTVASHPEEHPLRAGSEKYVEKQDG